MERVIGPIPVRLLNRVANRAGTGIVITEDCEVGFILTRRSVQDAVRHREINTLCALEVR